MSLRNSYGDSVEAKLAGTYAGAYRAELEVLSPKGDLLDSPKVAWTVGAGGSVEDWWSAYFSAMRGPGGFGHVEAPASAPEPGKRTSKLYERIKREFNLAAFSVEIVRVTRVKGS
jgi:hypothetical protein